MRTRNIFSGRYLDRQAHRRDDTEWFTDALADPRSRVLPIWNARSLVADGPEPRATFLELHAIPPQRRNADSLILLGRFNGAPVFAYEMEAADAPPLAAASRFEDLRQIAATLPRDEAAVLAYARAMVWWRFRHRFCGSCGSKTASVKGGHVLVCSNPACRHEIFPRLDPAIIVLISDGDRTLLGRQASWPAGRYSTIAGFVEPGESLEDAVTREVSEETGIEVGEIEYHSSQPWPFPSSLMLGFTAHALNDEIQLQDQELEDARWFTRAEIAAGTPLLPSIQSISYTLLEHWFDSAGGQRLRDLPGVRSWPPPR